MFKLVGNSLLQAVSAARFSAVKELSSGAGILIAAPLPEAGATDVLRNMFDGSTEALCAVAKSKFGQPVFLVNDSSTPALMDWNAEANPFRGNPILFPSKAQWESAGMKRTDEMEILYLPSHVSRFSRAAIYTFDGNDPSIDVEAAIRDASPHYCFNMILSGAAMINITRNFGVQRQNEFVGERVDPDDVSHVLDGSHVVSGALDTVSRDPAKSTLLSQWYAVLSHQVRGFFPVHLLDHAKRAAAKGDVNGTILSFQGALRALMPMIQHLAALEGVEPEVRAELGPKLQRAVRMMRALMSELEGGG